MKIKVDGKSFNSRKKALDFYKQAYMFTDGSEKSRMGFAYFALQDGCSAIDTYNSIAY